MTFSIVGHCRQTNMAGVAITTSSICGTDGVIIILLPSSLSAADPSRRSVNICSHQILNSSPSSTALHTHTAIASLYHYEHYEE